MKQTFLFLAITFALSISSFGKYTNINTIIKAEAKNGVNLTDLLKDITLIATKGLQNEKGLMKVSKVAKGSVYEKYGVKAGDLVYMSFDGNFDPIPKNSNQ